jgi:hypothetical protein
VAARDVTVDDSLKERTAGDLICSGSSCERLLAARVARVFDVITGAGFEDCLVLREELGVQSLSLPRTLLSVWGVRRFVALCALRLRDSSASSPFCIPLSPAVLSALDDLSTRLGNRGADETALGMADLVAFCV